MKKRMLYFIISLITTKCSLCYNSIGVDSIPVQQNGIEYVIIEKMDASGIEKNMITYRIFIDLEIDYRFQLITGTSELGEMYFKTTGKWYNTPVSGHFLGDSINGLMIEKNILPNLNFDSFLTAGLSADDRMGVPYFESHKGYIRKYLSNTLIFPDLDLSMFDKNPSTENFVTSNGTISFNPTLVKGGVKGPYQSNIVMIGQFTTDGIFEFKINCQIHHYLSGKNYTISNIYYSSNE